MTTFCPFRMSASSACNSLSRSVNVSSSARSPKRNGLRTVAIAIRYQAHVSMRSFIIRKCANRSGANFEAEGKDVNEGDSLGPRRRRLAEGENVEAEGKDV